MKQRIVLTGGSGFIGSFLVERLVQKRYQEIVVLDRNPKPQPGARFVKCNVFSQPEVLKEEIHTNDIVIHLACTTTPGPGAGEEDRIHNAEDDIVGTLRLIELCKTRKIQKFIFPSSGGTVYGSNTKGNHSETDNTSPKSSYGAIKVATEKYLEVFKHLYGMEYAILRISNPYGRKELLTQKLGAVDVFLRRAMAKQDVIIWGDGKNVRDYIYIDDVIDFFLLSIEKESVHGVYNVGTGQGTSLDEIVSLIRNVLGRDFEVNYKPSRAVDVRHNVLDISKAKAIGWRPKYTLREGIVLTYIGITP